MSLSESLKDLALDQNSINTYFRLTNITFSYFNLYNYSVNIQNNANGIYKQFVKYSGNQ